MILIRIAESPPWKGAGGWLSHHQYPHKKSHQPFGCLLHDIKNWCDLIGMVKASCPNIHGFLYFYSGLKVTAQSLLSFYRFEQGFEVTFTERLGSFALDDLIEYSWSIFYIPLLHWQCSHFDCLVGDCHTHYHSLKIPHFPRGWLSVSTLIRVQRTEFNPTGLMTWFKQQQVLPNKYCSLTSQP